jgi:type I restriction enzyme S subunit
MKDSGVEWIGEIPKGWEVGKIYQYSKMYSGSTPSRTISEYWEDGTIPWMSSGEVNKKKIKTIDGRITELGYKNSNTPMLPIGTIIIGLNGQGKTKGTVGILEVETTCNQSLCGMVFNDVVIPMFSFYFLDTQYYHLRGLVGEGQREGISVSFLGRYPFIIPPLSEQSQIVSYLDEQTQLIDKTISVEERRIELLKEYRQSLISEVVTGKRKVTNDE